MGKYKEKNNKKRNPKFAFAQDDVVRYGKAYHIIALRMKIPKKK